MKKFSRLFLIEFIFFIAVVGFIGVAQFSLTATSIYDQIETHLTDIENSIDKFDESEEIGRQSIAAVPTQSKIS